MSRLLLSDYDVKNVARYIVDSHKRFMASAADNNLDSDSIRTQANSAFSQLTGISLVFVKYDDINDFISDMQKQVWNITNEYFGFFGKED